MISKDQKADKEFLKNLKRGTLEKLKELKKIKGE